MACTIDSTVGGANANSYSSIADADSYHETHLYASDWEDADTDDKCRALQMATRLLDQRFEWNGVAVGSTQALLWPRVAATYPNGHPIPSDIVPTAVKHATAELARQLIADDRTADSDTEAKGIKAMTVGSISMEFRSVAAKPIPDSVTGFLVPYYGRLVAVGGGAVTLLRA